MSGNTLQRVREASKVGSIRCHEDQCKRCIAAANEGLVAGLKEILATLERENEEGVAIQDTIWHGDAETLFDYIGRLIAEHGGENG